MAISQDMPARETGGQPDCKVSSSKASCLARIVRGSRTPLLPAIPAYLQMLTTFGRRQAGDVKHYSNSTGPVIRKLIQLLGKHGSVGGW